MANGADEKNESSPTPHRGVERRRRAEPEAKAEASAEESETSDEAAAEGPRVVASAKPDASSARVMRAETTTAAGIPSAKAQGAGPSGPSGAATDTGRANGEAPASAAGTSVSGAESPPASAAQFSAEAAPPAKAAPAEPQASFADLFDDADVPKKQRVGVGDVVEGPVVLVGADGVFVDIGGHQQAFYPRSQLLDSRGELKVGQGDVLRGHVVRIGDDGTPELGRRMTSGMSTDELEAAMREEIPVEGKVTGVNKGGVSVDLGGTRAFCPIGQLDKGFVADASVFLQQTLQFLVIEVREGKDVVLSRKKIREREAAMSREKLLDELKVGDQRVGTVVRVRDFGAFVELADGIDGLIPNREISYDRRRADQVVSTGQSVEVMIQEIQRKDGDLRITLSLKALADDPWDAVQRVASPGQVTQGVVRRLMEFGAFIELAPGIEGLLHVSELGGGQRHPSSFLSIGEPLLVTVKSVDPDRKRIALAPAPEGATAGQRVDGNQPRVGDIVKAKVDRVERYGVFVQIEGVPGREGRGLIHEKELGLSHGADAKKAFPPGKEVEAKVIATGKLALSIKAIAEDEARREVEAYQQKQSSKGMGTLGDLLKDL